MTPLFAMTDETMRLWLEVAAAIIFLLRQHIIAKAAATQTKEVKEDLAQVAQKTEVKAEEVKQTLEAATAGTAGMLQGLKETASATHALVNDRHGAALHAVAALARELATLKDTPESNREADKAERLAREHDASQARADDAQARATARAQERDLARAQAQERDRPPGLPGKTKF